MSDHREDTCVNCMTQGDRTSEALPQRDVYMVNVNAFSGCVFVKVLDFFRQQGGFEKEWGTHWVPVVATSIEDAREKGCALPGAKPYERQAK
jgi:hypothetical protein